jgi:hypothetical protein
MKRLLFTILCFIFFTKINLNAQENFGPSEHSNKWLDGREMYVKVIDSVKLKINFMQSTNDWWVFEAEFINQSAVNDVLVDPALIQFGVIKTTDSKTCDLSTNKALPLVIEDAFNIDLKNMLKKNTIEPKKSLYGLMIFKRCKRALNVKMLIPVDERYFLAEFERIAKN